MNPNESTHNIDPFELRKLYKYLRVADVCDGMDGVGHFDTGLMSPEVRPLWHGMRFWGLLSPFVAFLPTAQCGN